MTVPEPSPPVRPPVLLAPWLDFPGTEKLPERLAIVHGVGSALLVELRRRTPGANWHDDALWVADVRFPKRDSLARLAEAAGRDAGLGLPNSRQLRFCLGIIIEFLSSGEQGGASDRKESVRHGRNVVPRDD